MNKREKTLLLVIGAVAVILLGWKGYGKYQDALEAQRAEISRQEAKLAAVKLEQRQAIEGQHKWQNLGAQTFSMDESVAKGRFRDELFELCKIANLTNPDVTLMSSAGWMKNGVRILPASISAEGSPGNMVDFLFEFYRAPFIGRCKSLNIQPVMDKKKPGVFKLTASVETLILPKNKKVPSITTVELQKGKRKPVERNLYAKADYDVITSRKLMEPYSPPAPPPPPPRPTDPVVKAAPPPPPPPPPPADANKVLARVISSPLSQQAVLQDPGVGNSPTAVDTRIQVGETLYGGTLVFVHPRGVVSEKDGALRFHPMGSALQANQPLTEKDQPDVYYELKKLQARSEGIRVSPG